MDAWLFIMGLLVLLVPIGWAMIRYEYQDIQVKAAFVHEYFTKFSEFANKYLNRELDNGLYIWLTQNVNRIHRELGDHAIMDYYIAPYTREVVPNYPLFINALPQFHRVVPDERNMRELTMMCQDALLRGAGAINDRIDILQQELHSPLVWLREGVRLLFALPFHVLRWTGLDRYGLFHWLSSSSLGRLLTSLGWTLSCAFGLVGFIADWQPFTDVVRTWFP